MQERGAGRGRDLGLVARGAWVLAPVVLFAAWAWAPVRGAADRPPAPVALNAGANVVYETAAFDFPEQTPGGVLTAGASARIEMAPCPQGIAGGNIDHRLYLSGGSGEAEVVAITGGSCTSGATSGTIEFTPAKGHSGAWMVESATAGLQEALAAMPGQTGTLQLSEKRTIRVNLQIPESAAVRFSEGGRLEPEQGVVVTIRGQIEAPSVQLFGGPGVVIVSTYNRTSGSRSSNSTVDARWWGCTGDNKTDNANCFRSVFGRLEEDGAMRRGSATLTASMEFTASDTGKEIAVYGAGTGGAPLATTIKRVTGPTRVELGEAAAETVAGKVIVLWGTFRSDRAMRVRIPSGIYQTSRTVHLGMPHSSCEVFGDGHGISIASAATAIRWTGQPGGTLARISNTANCVFRDFLLDGIKRAGIGLKFDAYVSLPSMRRNKVERVLILDVRGSPGRALQVGSGNNGDVGQNDFEYLEIRNAATGIHQEGTQTVTNRYRRGYLSAYDLGMDFVRGDSYVEGFAFQTATPSVGDIRINPDNAADASFWSVLRDNYFEKFAGCRAPAISFPAGFRTYPTLIEGNRIKWDAGSLASVRDGAISKETRALTSRSANFQPGDVGRPVRINGAGPGGRQLDTFIEARASATSVTLGDEARRSVSNAVVQMGGRFLYFGQKPVAGKTAKLTLIANTFDFTDRGVGMGTLHIDNTGPGLEVFLIGNTFEPALRFAPTGAVSYSLDGQPMVIAFASLPAGARNGVMYYCSDCAASNPCAGGGGGAMARRLEGRWKCD